MRLILWPICVAMAIVSKKDLNKDIIDTKDSMDDYLSSNEIFEQKPAVPTHHTEPSNIAKFQMEEPSVSEIVQNLFKENIQITNLNESESKMHLEDPKKPNNQTQV